MYFCRVTSTGKQLYKNSCWIYPSDAWCKWYWNHLILIPWYKQQWGLIFCNGCCSGFFGVIGNCAVMTTSLGYNSSCWFLKEHVVFEQNKFSNIHCLKHFPLTKILYVLRELSHNVGTHYTMSEALENAKIIKINLYSQIFSTN